MSDIGANLDVEQSGLEQWMHIISMHVGSTDAAISRNEIDFIRKQCSTDQVSLVPFCVN